MVRLNKEGEYSALGQGSGCQQEGEEITAVVCLPLFVPSTRLTQHYILCGYNTGWIRVFSESGVLLTAQQLETTSVLSIKVRAPPPVFKIAKLRQFANENEDVTILFRGNKIVTIDGQSLWMVLRVCDGQRESGIDASHMHTAFTYKKWDLQHQDEVNDILSLGPSPTYSQIPYNDPSTAISTTNAFPPKNATSQFIAVGSHPMLTYYATSESSKPLMSAASMASYVVSRVASPVFSFAKSWWGSSSSSSGSNTTTTISRHSTLHNNKTDNPTPYVPDLRRPPPTHIEPATPLPAVLSVNDAYRKINHIYLSPAPFISAVQRNTLAATTDALGRVVLWDIHEGQMLRIWKGVRDAVCGWVEVFEHELYQQPKNQTSFKKILLFLVMYSSKSGFLKIFQMRHGKQVGAYHVGPGWQLVSCGGEPLGSSMVSPERRVKASNKNHIGAEYNGLANCLLVGSDGEVRKIKIILKEALLQ
ncbi:Rab3 GTPase-activating protein regulatory subunit N-terminus-domain-containing protein [Mycotypha africana]|uniref:Rab3 GTPase-activating protein regulatory subunit N-terminus-domain-containing protein n=1 Tax=Mycotypha africana TaxID=64632 RepID=UPI002300106A|nr:Rab3 GTPase-activating protein regulatory subunit N-terminus-domain-containing protein [Mycotypha africana]KAI8969021.1 Rab3 GTPase-activating protein regulatory subunit N-terminus-domain-containing protein [Mycotypha africana]